MHDGRRSADISAVGFTREAGGPYPPSDIHGSGGTTMWRGVPVRGTGPTPVLRHQPRPERAEGPEPGPDRSAGAQGAAPPSSSR